MAKFSKDWKRDRALKREEADECEVACTTQVLEGRVITNVNVLPRQSIADRARARAREIREDLEARTVKIDMRALRADMDRQESARRGRRY